MFPRLGCVLVVLAFGLMCLMPVMFVDAMHSALGRLHLPGQAAGLAVAGILLGSVVNLPLYRIPRGERQVVHWSPVPGYDWLDRWAPKIVGESNDTIVALNVGGGLIPAAIAFWQMTYLSAEGGWPLRAAIAAMALNVAACYAASRPMRGVGIIIPGFISPMVALLTTWVLLGGDTWADWRAPVAFTAGVVGPLVGADLLRLRQVEQVSAGMVSIGGAGTFDGIVLSGVLAALLA